MTAVLISIVVLIIIVCVLLVGVVLLQNPKGGGLGATFGGVSNNLLGAQRTTDILEKATWTLGIIMIVLSLVSQIFVEDFNTQIGAPQPEVEGTFVPPADNGQNNGLNINTGEEESLPPME